MCECKLVKFPTPCDLTCTHDAFESLISSEGYYVCRNCGTVVERVVSDVGYYILGEDCHRPEISKNRHFGAIQHQTVFYPSEASASQRYLFYRLHRNVMFNIGSHLYHAQTIMQQVCKEFELGIGITEDCAKKFTTITSQVRVANKTVLGAAIVYDMIKSHELAISIDDVVQVYQNRLVKLNIHLLFKTLGKHPQYFAVKQANLGKLVTADIDRVIDYCMTIRRLEKKSTQRNRNVVTDYGALRSLANQVALKLVPLVENKFGSRPSILAQAVTYACFVIVQQKLGLPSLITTKIVGAAFRTTDYQIRDIFVTYLAKYAKKKRTTDPKCIANSRTYRNGHTL